MTPTAKNPLSEPWSTPHGLPPFAAILPAHYGPALRQAMAAHLHMLDGIADNAAPPDFANTALAFDKAGHPVRQLAMLFVNMVAAETSPELQAAEVELAPLLAGHEALVLQHPGVFARLDALFKQRATLGLDAEPLRVLERIHLDFCLAGARLGPQDRQKALHIAEKLATLQTRFAQNVLADESAFELVLAEPDLAGLPDSVRNAAKQAAIARHKPDAWLITLSRSLMTPFLTHSTRRDLRQAAWQAWVRRGQLSAERNNLAVIAEILALRHQLAVLHGHASFADFALQDTMAQKPQAVMDLLQRAWQPALAKFAVERTDLQAFAAENGMTEPLQPWDWRMWAEKMRAERFVVDDAAVKPYFALPNMMAAMFDCAQRLFGLRFAERFGVELYHPDARMFEVFGPDDQLLGVFLSDNYARATKRGGAWMNEYRYQVGGAEKVVPIVGNHNNFNKPAAGQPCLLSLDDLRTLFHEFGHGLHGLLSNVTYERLACTRVLRDFVELPSQLFEHWALEPQVLGQHARHIETGEPIAPELVQRLLAARQFNAACDTLEYLASALLDQALHCRPGAENGDLDAFEQTELRRLGMPAEVVPRHRLPHFLHLFSGPEYAAAYYVYIWAEVLDADAYEAFVDAGDPFDAAVAGRLLRHVYAGGNASEPGAAYRAFRGRDPDIGAMLRKRGLAG